MAQLQVLVIGSADCARMVGAACRGRRIRVNGPFPPSIASAAGLNPGVIVFEAHAEAGLEPLRDVRSTFPGAAVIVAAASADPRLAAESVAGGACGVVVLGDDDEQLPAMFHHAAAGEIILTTELLAAMVRPTPSPSDEGVGCLTGREREVLELVAAGVATSQIAMRLGISAATVQSHVSSILGKLHVRSKVEAARVAWREGAAELTAGV